MTEARHWTVEDNATYRRKNLLSGWIVRFDPTPKLVVSKDGSTRVGMSFAAIVLTDWVSDPEKAAEAIAADLNEADTLRAEVARLEAENAKLREGSWQPIETAPKDGARFLALEGTRHFDCWWHFFSLDAVYNWQDEADSEPEPTHWMPLPKGPQS